EAPLGASDEVGVEVGDPQVVHRLVLAGGLRLGNRHPPVLRADRVSRLDLPDWRPALPLDEERVLLGGADDHLGRHRPPPAALEPALVAGLQVALVGPPPVLDEHVLDELLRLARRGGVRLARRVLTGRWAGREEHAERAARTGDTALL